MHYHTAFLLINYPLINTWIFAFYQVEPICYIKFASLNGIANFTWICKNRYEFKIFELSKM